MSNQSLVQVPQSGQNLPAGAPKGGVKQSSRVSRHLAQAVQLEESGTLPLIRFTMILAGVACLCFVVWSALTKIDEVASTEGEVVPVGSVLTVQHFEGGLVDDIMVREGVLVEEGHPILKLSPAAALADLDQTRAREITLLLKAERLRAFTEGREPDFSFARQYERLVADNLTIYHSQRQAQISARSVIQAQIEQKRSDLNVLKTQITALEEQIESLEQVLLMKEELFGKGLISRVSYLDARREHARIQGELTRTVGQSQTAQESLREMQQRLEDQKSTAEKQAFDELGATIAEIAQVQETIGRLEDRVNRLVVLAPVRGYVKGLTVKNAGAVIQPGGLVCELVPADREMIVESKIQPRDIGHVKVGQRVKVKVATYDFARYGSIFGELQSVSAASFITEKGEPYFKAKVRLEKNYVGEEPGKHVISPGMTVQAEIITGDKTLLQYMLKPVFSQMQQSFHER